MGVVMRMAVIGAMGMGRYHSQMLYYNIWGVHERAACGQATSDLTKASPANRPTIDSTTDPST